VKIESDIALYAFTTQTKMVFGRNQYFFYGRRETKEKIYTNVTSLEYQIAVSKGPFKASRHKQYHTMMKLCNFDRPKRLTCYKSASRTIMIHIYVNTKRCYITFNILRLVCIIISKEIIFFRHEKERKMKRKKNFEIFANSACSGFNLFC